VLPVTIWAGDVGTAVRETPEGTPLTVVGRLSAREYHTVIPASSTALGHVFGHAEGRGG
jgi:hypothetical protein